LPLLDAPPLNVDEEPVNDEDFIESDLLDTNSLSFIGSSKAFLHETLDRTRLQGRSLKLAIEQFNAFLEGEDPFSDHHLPNGDYSWIQIRASFLLFEDIADITLCLHASPTSEASCERTISTQRLILTARRLNSKSACLTQDSP
jgi:hypothetical protein